MRNGASASSRAHISHQLLKASLSVYVLCELEIVHSNKLLLEKILALVKVEVLSSFCSFIQKELKVLLDHYFAWLPKKYLPEARRPNREKEDPQYPV